MVNDESKNPEGIALNPVVKSGKTSNPPTPDESGDESRTVSFRYSSDGFIILDALGKVLKMDRAGTCRWLMLFALTRICEPGGKFNIPTEDKRRVPYANMVGYELTDVKF
jgi:hypothetical protein